MSDLILTKHARERMELRKITEDMVYSVIHSPRKTYPGKKEGTVKFIRTLDGRDIHVVATLLPEKKQWLIVSLWVRGEDDPQPFAWQLLTAPFKLVWWLCKKLLGQK